jgi:hypothetical protein
VGLHITHLLSERLRRYETRLEDITIKNVLQRLASLILLLITRAFGLLQDQGVVELRRRLIYIKDVEALRRAAGHVDEREG